MDWSKEIVVERYVHPYVIERPVVQDIPVKSYEGMSLEEIEDRYGRDEAVGVYQFIAQSGIDPTKPKPPEFKTEYISIIGANIGFEDDLVLIDISIKDQFRDKWVLLMSGSFARPTNSVKRADELVNMSLKELGLV